ATFWLASPLMLTIVTLLFSGFTTKSVASSLVTAMALECVGLSGMALPGTGVAAPAGGAVAPWAGGALVAAGGTDVVCAAGPLVGATPVGAAPVSQPPSTTPRTMALRITTSQRI